ncbi:MAG TPA: glycoside hydrolase family 16 protein [Puia sp.]|uniref:glycoside hydrolase family 16 protein n=1 Tax=Puia sp. TaxID=2045100 RepID=UPI002BC5C5B3|nr:glycoside hydrolase family 16 protein [Puia sp.]HVU94610.1 glycoside hydrolase family 16 protein [Puia sp.]
MVHSIVSVTAFCLVFALNAEAQRSPAFVENFNAPTLQRFNYASRGVEDSLKWEVGAPSSVEPGTKVLLFRIDPRDSAGAGRGPEIVSKEFTFYGGYSARIKIPDVRKVQPNTGAVVGYFTYYMDPVKGLSEIDIEWLVADPHIVYIGTWTGAEGKLQRIGRTIDVSKGSILSTISKVNYTGVATPLTGEQNEPQTLAAIPDYDASARFYTYGFDWQADRIRWWMLHPVTGRKMVLWDYHGSALGIPRFASLYRMNFWHTNNWAVETNPHALERPLSGYPLEVDWMKYVPAGN